MVRKGSGLKRPRRGFRRGTMRTPGGKPTQPASQHAHIEITSQHQDRRKIEQRARRLALQLASD